MRAWQAGVVVVSGLWCTAARAQSIELSLDEEKAAQLGIDLAVVEQQLDAEAGEALKLVDPQTFMDSMATATGIASKGMGVDYASNMKRFVVGGSLGSAVHSAGFRFNRTDDPLPPGGFAFMVSAMGGVNLGLLDGGEKTVLDRVRLYVNGMAFSLPSDREFGGDMMNLGAHLQLKLANGTEGPVRWGGLDVTSGWERTQYSLSLARDLPLTAPVDEAELTWTASGTYDIVAASDSIPVELSTNVSVPFVTLFVGGAIDINTSTSTSLAALQGPVTAKVRSVEEELGSASLTWGIDGVGEPLVPRAFGGVQIDASVLKIYGHLNAGLQGAVGGHVGARLAM